MIDLFVNKVILYDDNFDIIFNASEDNTQNVKLENIEDYTNLKNHLNNKKEQPEHNEWFGLLSFGADGRT